MSANDQAQDNSMLKEQQLQFRVGMFVILTCIAAGVMIFQFGKLQSYWQPRYALAIHFETAPGVYPSTPVRRNGISIGKVSEIRFDDERGGVIVVVEIRNEVRLRQDAKPRLVRTFLGDSSIEFSPGKSQQFLSGGIMLKGELPSDPMQIVNRMEEKMTVTLDSFHATSHEWEQVGRTLNDFLLTNHGNLNVVIERAATALHQFTETMRNADATLAEARQVIGDPQNQQNLRDALAALPKLAEETHETIVAVRGAITNAEKNLKNIEQLTDPLARHSASIVGRLDHSLGNLESLTAELNDFAQLMTNEDGTLRKLAVDPRLYQNLNRSASSLAVLLKNVEPIVRDLRIFSDKVARHPELIGVGGAFRGSSGLKDPPEAETQYRGGTVDRGRPPRR
jgi:phospholipid/cholesterol/gamma-HCH transport system substrate-binding protein